MLVPTSIEQFNGDRKCNNNVWYAYTTYRNANHNVPDICTWNSLNNSVQIIDIPVPMDNNVVIKTVETIAKYSRLVINIGKCLNIEKKRKQYPFCKSS